MKSMSQADSAACVRELRKEKPKIVQDSESLGLKARTQREGWRKQRLQKKRSGQIMNVERVQPHNVGNRKTEEF